MTLATWPSSVTLLFMAGSYQERPQRTVDSFAVDHGPPLENLSTSVPSTIISGSIQCTTAEEYEDLLEFYETTLRMGLLHFTRLHPRKLSASPAVQNEFKFEDFQLSRVIADNIHEVSVVLRYFPPVT